MNTNTNILVASKTTTNRDFGDATRYRHQAEYIAQMSDLDVINDSKLVHIAVNGALRAVEA